MSDVNDCLKISNKFKYRRGLVYLTCKTCQKPSRHEALAALHSHMAEWNALMSEGGQKLLEQDFAGAVACFDSALALDPASAPKHWQRAIALYYLSR